MDIHGQAAIVTGGASGLGAETARQLVQAGAKVSLFDRNAEAAQAWANEIGAFAAACDVTSPDSVQAALAKARDKHGPARVLVHCAGIGGAKRILGREGPQPLEEFTRILNVNLFGAFNMLRLCASEMSALAPVEDGERGVIILTASIAAYDGQIGQAAYAASKGAIVSLTLPAARELAQFGIRVVTLAPGLFQTPLMQELPPQVQADLAASIPFPKRLGKPSEFARLALHCITNTALNGEVIRIDGALRLAPR
jgi:NAD(P)-dependent dehydrogenase (short-subunit alcohol dehydrogenase family)